MHLVEAQLCQQVEGAAELLVGLAAEADDDVGADGGGGQPAADLVDHVPVFAQGVAAPHAGQNRVVARLHGDVEVLAHLGQLGHRADDVVGQVLWVGGEEANALEAFDVVDGAEEVGQAGPVGQVVAVGLHRLAQKGHLLHAAGDQHLHLVDHLGDGAAALAAAAVRDDAEGAELVAAVDDRHVGCGARGLGEGLRPELPACGLLGGHGRQDIVEGLGAGEDVDEGEALQQAVRAQADHAAHHGDLRTAAVGALFQASQRAELADASLLGLLADDAGVNDNEISLLGPGRLLPAQALKAGRQLGGVGLVHLTAHGPDVVSRHGQSVKNRPRWGHLAGFGTPNVCNQTDRGGGNGIRTHEGTIHPLPA